MSKPDSSSRFTHVASGRPALGPPLIGALLRVPLDAVQHAMIQRLHERGFDDIEPAHLAVLRYPGPHGARPSDLAAELRISKQALNYLLGQLERRGYLERHPDAGDRRSKRIALTDRGIAAAEAIREAVREVEKLWSKQLGAQRFAQLRELLVDLNERI